MFFIKVNKYVKHFSLEKEAIRLDNEEKVTRAMVKKLEQKISEFEAKSLEEKRNHDNLNKKFKDIKNAVGSSEEKNKSLSLMFKVK